MRCSCSRHITRLTIDETKRPPFCPQKKDYIKDFEGARRAGWHAILLNRYNEQDRADEWKRRGAIVLDDLMDVVLWLGQSGCKLG